MDFTIFLILIVLVALVFYALNKINSTLNQKLTDVRSDFTQHLVTSQSTLTNITKELTELKSASQDILEVGENIQSLQDILKPPKLRGELGELFLEQMLEQILPKNFYQTQYKFQSGEIVDAVIKLKDSQKLCIDAKFPLDSFKNNESNGQFVRDIKKHIDSISTKYIVPNEGTLDFALMYIPAENVYYEIILKDEKITSYAKEKHVLPVSPLSLYSYLSTVLIGLKGIELEKNAKQILSSISNLKINFENFILEFDKLGTHLTNAKNKYDISREQILNISEKLNNIETVK